MRFEELEREIRAERPEPDTEFARRLDEWAAAGFPRGGEHDPRAERRRGAGASGWIARLRDRLSAAPPRRLLAPAGALATLFVVGAVAITQSGEIDGGSDDTAAQLDGGSPAASQIDQGQAQEKGGRRGFDVQDARRSIEETSRSSTEGEIAESLDAREDSILPLPGEPPVLPPPDGGDGGGIARGTDRRLVDASARLTLGAEADEVQDVANRVVDVTDSYKGIVLHSQVTSDQAGARASFSLEIPYRDLDPALEDLSGLADVISLTEQGEDITQRAVRARKDLADAHDQIAKARIELIQADTREERLIIKSRISSLEATADSIEQQLGGVKRQARFATVSVEVTSSGPEADEGDGWSLGDALEDAGRVLEVIGGIALVSLAVLAPLALLGVVAWFVVSRMRVRSRERALDE